MKLGFLPLKTRLSSISWISIECLLLASVALLPFSKSFVEIGLTTALVLWALRKFPWDDPLPEVPRLYVISYAVFISACFLSVTQAPLELRWLSLKAVVKWIQYLGLFWMCFDLFKEPARRNRFLWVFVLSMGVVALNGVYQVATGVDLFRGRILDVPGRYFRVTSSFNEPNGLATFLFVTIPLVFWLWIRDKKWSIRGVWAVIFLGLLGGLFVMTLSRGAFIVFFASVFAYLLFRKKFLAAAIGLPMLLLFMFSSGVTQKNFVSSLHSDDITIRERLNSWKLTVKMIQARPVLGNGCGLYYERIHEWESNVARFRRYAQNSYLRLWSEVGLFGFIGFMTPLVFLFYRASPFLNPDERYGWTHAIYVGLSAFLLQSAFDANFHAFQTSVLFWMFWALFVSIRATRRPQENF